MMFGEPICWMPLNIAKYMSVVDIHDVEYVSVYVYGSYEIIHVQMIVHVCIQ